MRFEIIGSGHQLALRDFFIRCTVITKLADTEAVFRTDRRTKDSASHRARRVQFALSCLRRQYGADFIVPKFFEALERRFISAQDSRLNISGESIQKPRQRLPRTLPYRPGSLGISAFKLSQSAPQPERIA